jgi:hypothetical protein
MTPLKEFHPWSGNPCRRWPPAFGTRHGERMSRQQSCKSRRPDAAPLRYAIGATTIFNAVEDSSPKKITIDIGPRVSLPAFPPGRIIVDQIRL